MKLKNLFNVLFVAAVVSACGDSAQKEKTPAENTIAQKDSVTPATAPHAGIVENNIFGAYVGMFEAEKINNRGLAMHANKINLSLDSIKGQTLYGHSVVAGNIRPFSGLIALNNGTYTAEVKEPGDNKYDGVFVFSLSDVNYLLTGTWTANNKTLPVSARKYTLEKRTFKYDPTQELHLDAEDHIAVYNPEEDGEADAEFITGDAAKINASVEALTKKDVENMYKRDLEVMRNAIYARHGYSFKNREMRSFFDQQVSWYMPVYTDVSAALTPVEKENIALIKRYEKHATAYYDSFGR